MNQVVVVFLRGGADGLSLLAPIGDPDYPAARGSIALDPTTALPVDGSFALHPNLAQLASRVGSGGVALVPAVGIPELSRSHFDAQFRTEEGGAAQGSGDGAGWLGRYLRATAGGTAEQGSNPYRGVCFGQAGLPHVLAGTPDAIAASSLSGLRLGPGRTAAPAALEESMRSMWAQADSQWASDALSGFEAIDTAATLISDESDTGGFPGGRSGTPDHGVADTIATASADVGTEVAVVNIGGWDTHDNQGTADGTFAGLVTQLDAALSSLRDGLPEATVVVVSEFGRRIAQNSSGGCDHGRGGLAVVEGPEVAGGVHGDWTALADSDGGDVRVVNDVRVVMAEISESVLGAERDEVVPEAPDSALGLFV